MRSIFLIVTILTSTALTQDPDACKFSEAAQHCYGAEGQPLIFHVPNTTNTDIHFRLKKDKGILILIVNNNKITQRHEELASDAELLPNGRFSLGKAMKEHSGDYMLDEFTAEGKSKGILKVHLEIQAPVSKPAVSQKRLSSEKTTVSSSSEGEGLEFSLTLNGHSIVQTKDSSKFPDNREENMLSSAGGKAKNVPSATAVSISLQGQTTGDLIYDVQNKVSREGTVYQPNSAKVSSSFPIVAARVTFFAIFLLIAPVLVLIKFCDRNQTPEAENEDVTKNKGETMRRYSKTQSMNKWEQV